MAEHKLFRRNVGGGGGDGGGAGATMMMIEESPASATLSTPLERPATTSPTAAAPSSEASTAITSDVGRYSPLEVVAPGGGGLGSTAAAAEEETEPLTTPAELDDDDGRRCRRERRRAAKIRHWREGPYAAGLVEIMWRDEALSSNSNDNDDSSDDCMYKDDPGDGCVDCCTRISGRVCSKLGFGRVGNMVILKESVALVEEEQQDVNEALRECEAGNGEEEQIESRRFSKRRKIDLILGPFWPMLFFVTWPLILCVSYLTLVHAILTKSAMFTTSTHSVITIVWTVSTLSLICALCGVSCRDPGILPRRRTPALQVAAAGAAAGDNKRLQRWNERAQSYTPRGAVYDRDCAVVIEEFDHTCPWTGTAIGRGNINQFYCFVGLIPFLLIFDMMLLVLSAVELPTEGGKVAS